MHTLMLNNIELCHYADADMGEKESRHGRMFVCFGFTKAPNKMTLMSHLSMDMYISLYQVMFFYFFLCIVVPV